MSILLQVAWLFILAIPVACMAWTVTHEEVFREPRQFCIEKSKESKTVIERKFFYLFTCEYCFSHYVAIGFLFLTNFKLLLNDWRGVVIAWFSLVWVANFYMCFLSLLRQDIKKEKTQIEYMEEGRQP
jgi:hypothetical protein